jgi:hypothetical protein
LPPACHRRPVAAGSPLYLGAAAGVSIREVSGKDASLVA